MMKYTMRVCLYDCKLTNAAERVETKQLNLRVCARQDLSRAHYAVTYAYAHKSRQGSHVMIRFHTGWKRVINLLNWTHKRELVLIRSPSSAIWGIIKMLLHRLAEETMTKQPVLYLRFQNLKTKNWENRDPEKWDRIHDSLMLKRDS